MQFLSLFHLNIDQSPAQRLLLGLQPQNIFTIIFLLLLMVMLKHGQLVLAILSVNDMAFDQNLA
jgi:hypothetical protein